MIEPRPLTIIDGWADTELTGAPVIECVLQAFVGRCQACGRAAEEQIDGHVVINPFVVDGTLYGDSFCVGCDDEEHTGPTFVMPPVCEPDAEGGDAY